MTVESDCNSRNLMDDFKWPPGFRFHPTDEELVLYWLKRKICGKRLRLYIIAELDVYKWDPEELPGQSVLKTGDRQWYFFSPRDRKYPNGGRSNRATRHGYWKVTGKDRIVMSNARAVGVKKTLVFYKGRAPHGERTDWVMHEYTLDEEELKRSRNVQDYYALYKVYKKSGPGPKNGEQYGAPFKEEEWADDGNLDVVNTVHQEIHPKEVSEVTPEQDSEVNSVDKVQPPLDGIEEIWNAVADASEFLPGPGGDCFDQILREEEMQRTFLESLSKDMVSSEPAFVLNRSLPQHDFQGCFDASQSGNSQSELPEISEVTYVDGVTAVQEDSHGDFLEIADLVNPVPASGNMNKPEEKLKFEGFSGLSELDLFHDATMFLQDIGSTGPLNVPPLDVGSYDVLMNQSNNQNQQLQSHYAYQSSNQLWWHDENCDLLSETTQGVQPPSGVVSESAANHNEAAQNQSNREDAGAVSRFSSALWSFVESIPTAPASASENALVNRALVRMSSFSRLRVNSIATSVGASNASMTMRSGRSRGFLLFYIIGILGALFGVLIGSLRLWKMCVS